MNENQLAIVIAAIKNVKELNGYANLERDISKFKLVVLRSVWGIVKFDGGMCAVDLFIVDFSEYGTGRIIGVERPKFKRRKIILNILIMGMKNQNLCLVPHVSTVEIREGRMEAWEGTSYPFRVLDLSQGYYWMHKTRNYISITSNISLFTGQSKFL